jgi:hypothetical protein
LAHHSTKSNYGSSPKTKGSILKYRVPPLWLTYIAERRTTFAKACGIKMRCYGEHVGEHIENSKGTHWEHDGNPLGTSREHIVNQGKMKKIPSPPPPKI